MGCILGKLAAADDDCPFSLSAILFPPTATAGDPLRAPLPPPSAAELRRNPSAAAAARDSAGWPLWLSAAAGDALTGWAPRRADSFQKLEKIGSGTYSNVYKAVDTATGRVVALKKVRVEPGAAAAARFMAREIALLRRLDGHPNVIRLHGIVTSRVAASPSLYLVLGYLDYDLAGISSAAAAASSSSSSSGAGPSARFSLPQVGVFLLSLPQVRRRGGSPERKDSPERKVSPERKKGER